MRCDYQMSYFSYLWKWILGTAKNRERLYHGSQKFWGACWAISTITNRQHNVGLIFLSTFGCFPLDFEPQVTSYWRYNFRILFDFIMPLAGSEFSWPLSYVFLCHLFLISYSICTIKWYYNIILISINF